MTTTGEAMKKASISAPFEPEKGDLQMEYPFDYRPAKPKRFADEGSNQGRPEPGLGMSMDRCLEAIAAAPLRPKMTSDSLKAVTREP